MYANPIANNSAGTQINRMLDALGYPDKFGDAIGALVDLRTGNLPGALRNLVDLNSGLSTRGMDRIFGGGRRPAFGRGFIHRHCCTGGHLVRHQHTYAVRQQVGKRAHIGQQYGFNWGPFQLKGRITGGQYVGSFAKPIKLANNQYLYRGRTYANLGAIARDARDGRIDGQATSYRTRTTYSWRPGFSPARPGCCLPPAFAFNPTLAAIAGGNALGGVIGNAINNGLSNIGNVLNGIFGGANGSGGAGNTGSTGSTGGTGSTGESVLSNPNLSLEDKLALLMAKLSEHLDEQINEKMGQIEKQMQQEKNGGAGGAGGSSKGGGGFLSSILGKAGGVVGTAFGGMFGGLAGSKIGSALGGLFGGGGSQGGSQGAGGSQNGQNGSNLQLLQSQLQTLLQKRQQMFQTMSNVMKSLHDTSMNTIRQLKA